MKRVAALLAPSVAIALVLLGPQPGSSEPFVDIYGGRAETESARVTAAHQGCAPSTFFIFSIGICTGETEATRNVHFDTSATFGIRGGNWFESVPWLGLAGDLSFFEAKGDNARFGIVPVSALVMFRVPLLRTEDIPKGQLQPYVAFGPSFFHQDASVDFRPQVDRKVTLSSFHVGADGRLGLAWQFHRHVGAFAEYRFTHLPIRADNEDDNDGSTKRVKATLDTSHLLVGLSFRF